MDNRSKGFSRPTHHDGLNVHTYWQLENIRIQRGMRTRMGKRNLFSPSLRVMNPQGFVIFSSGSRRGSAKNLADKSRCFPAAIQHDSQLDISDLQRCHRG